MATASASHVNSLTRSCDHSIRPDLPVEITWFIFPLSKVHNDIIVYMFLIVGCTPTQIISHKNVTEWRCQRLYTCSHSEVTKHLATKITKQKHTVLHLLATWKNINHIYNERYCFSFLTVSTRHVLFPDCWPVQIKQKQQYSFFTLALSMACTLSSI